MARGGRTLRTADGRKNLIGQRVKERRQQLKLTQEALNGRLAAITGAAWNPKTQEILHLERGTRLVTDLEVLALAKALESSLVWLLTGKEQEPTEEVVSAIYAPTDHSVTNSDVGEYS